MVKKIKNGFSLLEVMFAFAIFAAVAVSYTTGIGSNLAQSALMRDEVILRNLCEQKINELILNPPEFGEALTLKKDSGKFEGNEDYEWSVEYARMKIPDISTLMNSESEEGTEEQNDPASGAKKMIIGKLIKNIEELVWQTRVTVKDKRTDFSYTLSYWPINPNAKISFQ